MTVEELLTALRDVPGDMEVLVRCQNDESETIVGGVISAEPQFGCTDTEVFMIDGSESAE